MEAAGAAVRFDVDAEDADALRRVAKEWWAAGDLPREHRGGGGGGDGGDGGNSGSSGAGPGGFFSGFDRVVFNFPDRGVGVVGALAVRANQDMLASFFKTAKGLLAKEGEIHVAMQGGEARATWNVAGIAARGGLTYRAALDFTPEDFPGYQHFRTLPHVSLLRGGGSRSVSGRGAPGEDGGEESSDDDEDAMEEEEEEEEEERGDDDAGECIEAAEDDVVVGAKTFIFQVDKEKTSSRGGGGDRGRGGGGGGGVEGRGGGGGRSHNM